MRSKCGEMHESEANERDSEILQKLQDQHPPSPSPAYPDPPTASLPLTHLPLPPILPLPPSSSLSIDTEWDVNSIILVRACVLTAVGHKALSMLTRVPLQSHPSLSSFSLLGGETHPAPQHEQQDYCHCDEGGADTQYKLNKVPSK